MALAVALVSACGSNEKQPEPSAVADCVFPDDGKTPAPLWVCGAPFQDVKISAVGSYEKPGAGIDFQRTMATASARDFLASQMKVQVQGMIKRFTETTGAGDSETVDRLNTSVSKQITNETLTGSKVYITRANPTTGALYVLVGLDENLMREAAKHALNTSMKNDNALWQQFRAKQNFDELADEIAKQ